MDVWCGGRGRMFRYLMSWLRAVLVEKRRPQVAVVLCSSEHGAGKGLVLDSFIGAKLMGKGSYVQIGDINAIVGQFNDLSVNRLLINADEASSYGAAFKQNNIMRSLITEPTRKWERKGLDPVQADNFTNLVVTTNDAVPVKVECSDRRYFVLTPSSSKVGDRAYFDALAAQVGDPHAAVHFFKFLQQFEPVPDLWDIPLTEEKRELMEVNIPKPARFLQSEMQTGGLVGGQVVEAASLLARFREWDVLTAGPGAARRAEDHAWELHFRQVIKDLKFEKKKSNWMMYRMPTLQQLEVALRRSGGGLSEPLTAPHGTAPHGMARHGMAWHGTAPHAMYSTRSPCPRYRSCPSAGGAQLAAPRQPALLRAPCAAGRRPLRCSATAKGRAAPRGGCQPNHSP